MKGFSRNIPAKQTPETTLLILEHQHGWLATSSALMRSQHHTRAKAFARVWCWDRKKTLCSQASDPWDVAPPIYTPVMNRPITMKYFIHYDCTKGLSFVTLLYWYFFINIWMSSNFFECSIPVPHTTPAKMHQDAVWYSLKWRPGLSRTWKHIYSVMSIKYRKMTQHAQCLVLFSPTKVSFKTRG